MIRTIGLFLLVMGILASSVVAAAEKGIVETFTDGCKAELEKYCKDVTPGEERVLACLYAYGDKLSVPKWESGRPQPRRSGHRCSGMEK